MSKGLAWRAEAVAYDAARALLRLAGFDRASAWGARALGAIGPRTSKQRVVLRNLEIAFPGLDAAERQRLSEAAWVSMGRTFFEFPVMDRLDLDSRVEVIGREHLERDTPCIVVTGHFANWEVMAAVLAASPLDVAITYRRINNPHIDTRVRDQRRAYGVESLVPKSGPAGARHLLAALKAGQSIALLNDQKFNTGLSVPFFGQPAMTAPGAVRIALQAGVPILPMSCRRDGTRFVVTVEEAWMPDGVESGVERIVAFTEAVIREQPEQWFWAHRRWPKALYR